MVPRDVALRRELVRFVVVGIGNTILSVVVYSLLLALGAWYVVAAPTAYVASVVNGYVLNRRWTFGANDSGRARVLYVAVQTCGAALTSLLVALFVELGTGRVAAFLVAIVPVTLCTFAANRVWTFADRPQS
ncbi:MAG TPA: GtrA family protein [Gaiellaceae bacterium]|nr:GtrA family protein [Gaiellaceae bacterium]